MELAQLLGVDNLLGRKRGILKRGSKFHKRLAGASARRCRLRRLACGTGKGATTIFTAGVLPAASFGCEVLGVSNVELGKLQAVALSAMKPTTRGRSKSGIMTARGDPTWKAATAPIIRWAQELWWTQVPKSRAVPCLSMRTLRRAWAAAAARPVKSWGHVRGAVDAARLSLKRINWRFRDATHLVTDRGVCIPLLKTSPKLLGKLLRDGVQRAWQRKFGTSLRAEGWDGSRVCADPPRTLCNSKWAKANPLAAHHAVKAFVGGAWTKERAAKAGYVVKDMLCELCGEAVDTFEHRVCSCRAAAHVRQRHSKTMKQIKSCPELGPLFATRAIWRQPADSCPLPPVDGGTEIVWRDDIPEENRVAANLGGFMAFCDGSASKHAVEELRRAAWACAFVEPDGRLQASIVGPVWQNLPQTSQSAEYSATVAAIQTMSRPTHLVGDCLGVTKAAECLVRDGTPVGAHAGLMLSAAKSVNITNLKEVSWMPSHRALAESATDQQKLWHRGNEMVDELADEKRQAVEADIGADMLIDAGVTCRVAVSTLKMVGTILALWPPLPRSVERWNAGPRGRLAIGHDWQFCKVRGHWRCKTCGTYNGRAEAQGPPTTSDQCRPGRLLERITAAEQLGHSIAAVEVEGVQTHFCKTCGCHGTWLWRKLLTNCQGAPRSGLTRAWLVEALNGGEGLKAPPKAVRRPRKARADLVSDPEMAPVQPPPPHAPLRNRATASTDDLARWALLAPGCLSSQQRPAVSELPRAAAASRTAESAEAHAPQAGGGFRCQRQGVEVNRYAFTPGRGFCHQRQAARPLWPAAGPHD